MIKRVAIFARNPSGHGGIETVVAQHLRIFLAHGCDCLLFGQAGCDNIIPVSGNERRVALRNLMVDFKPDVCILHGSTHVGMPDDKVVFDELKIPTIVVCHFSFPSSMLLKGEEQVNEKFIVASKMCDMVVTVSKMDEIWWRANGLRAMHVQNPFIPPKTAGIRRRNDDGGMTNFIWVGRQAEPKQPSAALAAFARVHAAEPKTRLMMIGGSESGWKNYKKDAERFGCADAVEFVSERSDISEYWRRANLHLLTSITESFCLVLAEAKAYGIPTAMFEIPFLELVQGGKGLVTACQGDVEGLAESIIKVIRDKELLVKLSEEAKQSLVGFNDDAVWDSWQCVFKALETGDGGYEIPDEVRDVVVQASHGWNHYVRKNFYLMQMARDLEKLSGGLLSFKFMAVMLRKIVESVLKIKSAL